MKAMVLGRTGQVGWELCRALAPLGDVVALGRAEADLADSVRLREAVVDAESDVIINAAAYTAVDAAETDRAGAERINRDAVAELAQLAAETGAWLVHYSTDYVFDGAGAAPHGEDDPTGPINVYGESKLAGEEAIRSSGCKHLIFRTSWVHAARGKNFIRTILRLAKERTSLDVVADQIGGPTSAELIADVAAQAVRTVLSGAAPAGTYHLAAGGETSWHGLAQRVVATAARLGAALTLDESAIRPIATADYTTSARRPLNSRLGTQKLRSTFGITLPDWTVGADRTVAELVGA